MIKAGIYTTVKNSAGIKRFFIYGIMGWGTEIIWTGLGSLFSGDLRLIGYSNIWMFLIYGSVIFLEPIHDIIKKWPWFFRGVLWTVIIWGIEYTSGLVLVNILGVYPWIYRDPLAVDGLITLAYAPAWFVAGLIFERIHKALDFFIIKTSNY